MSRRRLALALLVLAAAAVVLGVRLAGGQTGRAPLGERDLSQAEGPQEEVYAAIDPRDADVVVAASNDDAARLMRIYTTRDGGRHWSSAPGPPTLAHDARDACIRGDPAAAIDARGREYLAFLETPDCRRFDSVVGLAWRDGPSGAWHTRPDPIAAREVPDADDKPALAADLARGRLYAVWTRDALEHRVLLARSDDRGATWSAPREVTRRTGWMLPSIAVEPGGAVDVGVDDPTAGKLLLFRSPDGTGRFTQRRTLLSTPLPMAPTSCTTIGAPIPAQRRRCVSSGLSLAVQPAGPRAGRLYATFSQRVRGRLQVVVAAYDPGDRLRPAAAAGPVTPATRADQFLPASGVDATTGTLWVCFYDTGSDATRRSAAYACVSRGSGAARWSPQRIAADVLSDESDAALASGDQFGDYEAIAAGHGVAYAFWTDGRDLGRLGEEIYARRLEER